MRLNYIDRLKGICMLLIIWGHTVTSLDIVSQWATGFKVTAFYIATGFLLGVRQEKNVIPKQTPTKKLLLTMGVPYLFYSVLSLALSALLMISGNRPEEFFTQKLLSTVTLSGISTLWFLPSMFFARLVFERLSNKKAFGWLKYVLTLCLPVLLWGLSLYIQQFFGKSESLFTEVLLMLFSTVFKSLTAFWFMITGFEMGKKRDFFEKKKSLTIVLTAASLLAGSVISIYNKGVDFNGNSLGKYPLFFFISGVLVSFSLINLCLLTEKVKMPLTEHIGKNSLFYMVTHMPLYILPLICLVTGKLTQGILQWIISFSVTVIVLSILLKIKNAVIKLLNEKLPNKKLLTFLNYI